jgi:hypothetical protein
MHLLPPGAEEVAMAIEQKLETPKNAPYLRTVAIICELCKKRYPGDDWDKDCYEHLDCGVEQRVLRKKAAVKQDLKLEEGTSYPEGGSYEGFVLDICPACFKDKLIPWFESQGGVVRKTESDY